MYPLRSLLFSGLVASLLAFGLSGSTAHAGSLDDLSRQTWRLGVAALDAVDATPAQRRAVSGAARALGKRLAPYEQDAVDWLQSAHRLVVSERVEREAVEAVRADGVQLIDDLSVPAVDFVVEVADTLTVQQRRELVRLAGRQVERALDR